MVGDTDLKDFIHINYKKLFSSWNSTFTFPAFLDGIYSIDCDILQFAGRSNKQHKKSTSIVRFCYFKYPVLGGFDGDGFKLLAQDLSKAAIDNGFRIFCNGMYPVKRLNSHGKRFSCSRVTPYRGDLKKRSQLLFRNISLHYDRKNSRGPQGKSMPRRSKTQRAIGKDCLCSFFFVVHYDSESFYVVNGIGDTNHSQHVQLSQESISYPSRLLSLDDNELIKQMFHGDANCGIIANVMYQKTGQMLSNSNIAYLGGLCNEFKSLDKMECSSTTDKMLNYLRENSYDYMMLLHDPIISAIRNETQMSRMCQVTPDSGKKVGDTNFSDVVNFTVEEEEEINKFVTKTRKAQNCLPTQLFSMAIAWVLPFERVTFEMFPEVLTVDTTKDTNNESRPLLTFCGKDNNGKMFTVLRAFIPNEQTWVFKWIFSIVFPKMFGKTIIDRIRIIISDGDSQEYGQLDAAIQEYMPHVYRARCGWHIIEKGWQTYVCGVTTFTDKQARFYHDISHHLKNWAYSWMKSSCETKAEYEMSKKMFIRFVNSPEILEKLGPIYPKNVLLFFRQHVEIWEAYYCYYMRNNIRHYGEYTNSIQEGTHKGMKFNAAPVTPATRLDHSLILLCKNAKRRSKRKLDEYTKHFCSQRPHSKLSCSNDLTEASEFTLQKNFDMLDNVLCHRIADRKWLVKCVKTEFGKSLQPVFQRIRTVTLCDDILQCNCSRTKVYGDTCIHALKVASTFPSFVCPKYQDYSVVWWKNYYHLVSQVKNGNEDVSKLAKAMLLLKWKEEVGIRISKKDFSSLGCLKVYEMNPEFDYDPSNPVCLNMPALDDEEIRIYSQPAGLTQESSITSDIAVSNGDTITEFLMNNGGTTTLDPYSNLICSFKELTDTYLGHATQDDIDEIKKFFQDKVAEMKGKIIKNRHDMSYQNEEIIPVPKGRYVSSNVAGSKRRKTHGNKSFCLKRKPRKK